VDQTGESQIADKRRQFLTQIPLSTLESYMAETSAEIGYLPLKGGDSITFVFDVLVESPSTLSAVNKNQYDISNNPYSGFTINGINFADERRRVAFVFHLTDKDAIFCHDYANAEVSNPPVSIITLDAAKKYVKANTKKITTLYSSAYLSALQAATVVSPVTAAELVANAKYALAQAEYDARNTASTVTTITSISS
jgi:hypothetical protein